VRAPALTRFIILVVRIYQVTARKDPHVITFGIRNGCFSNGLFPSSFFPHSDHIKLLVQSRQLGIHAEPMIIALVTDQSTNSLCDIQSLAKSVSRG
jgi:hypothetical protein